MKDKRPCVTHTGSPTPENGKEREKEKDKPKEQEKQRRRLKNSDDSEEKDSDWVFICASIGDCKAIRYSWKENKLFTITCNCPPLPSSKLCHRVHQNSNRTCNLAKGRSNAIDQRDPGGRLGPYKGTYADRSPDLRFVSLWFLYVFSLLLFLLLQKSGRLQRRVQ